MAELDHVLSLLRSEANEGDTAVGTGAGDTAVGPGSGEYESGLGADTRQPPRRTIQDIERLADEAQSVGHPTRLSIVGDTTELSPDVVHELHRIVREAVTNSLRHASAPGLSVSITVDEEAVTMISSNPSTKGRVRSGRGLDGIRERVELFGGTMRWTAEEGTWSLEAVLPRNEASAGPAGEVAADPGDEGRET